jgi:hypothetical protein
LFAEALIGEHSVLECGFKVHVFDVSRPRGFYGGSGHKCLMRVKGGVIESRMVIFVEVGVCGVVGGEDLVFGIKRLCEEGGFQWRIRESSLEKPLIF